MPVTATGSFPVHDISHKPRRYQHENIRQAQQESQEALSSSTVDSYVPRKLSAMSLESTITFCQEHSNDQDLGDFLKGVEKYLTDYRKLLIEQRSGIKADIL